MPDQPMTETQGTVADPVAQFRAWMQSQQSQMGPNMSHTQQQVQQDRRERQSGDPGEERSVQAVIP